MRMLYAKISFLILTSVCVLNGLSCGNSSNNTSSTTKERTLTVGMLHWAAFAPLNVADVKGFWKSQGLNVEVINYPSNQKLNGALTDGRIDIALDMIGSWVGLAKKGYAKLTILGQTDWSNGGDQIIAKRDFEIPKIKGQNVGVYLNLPSVTYFLGRFLADYNLKLSDVNVVEFTTSSIGSEFTNGAYKLIVNYEPESAKQLTPDAQGVRLKTSRDYPGVIPEGFAARTDVLATIPQEDLIRFFRGWAKAVQWAYAPENLNEYRNILRQYTYVGDTNAAGQPFTDAEIDQYLSNVKVHNVYEQYVYNTQNSENTLQKYLQDLEKFLRDNNQLPEGFSLAGMLDSSALAEALAPLQ